LHRLSNERCAERGSRYLTVLPFSRHVGVGTGLLT
jgi:hypothetical protein